MAHTYAALVGILRTWKVITWNLEIVESFRNGRRKDLSKFGGLKKKNVLFHKRIGRVEKTIETTSKS